MAMPNGLAHEAFRVALQALRLASQADTQLTHHELSRMWVDVYGATPMPANFTLAELLDLLLRYKENLASRLSAEVFKTGLLEQKLQLQEAELSRLRPLATALVDLTRKHADVTQQLLAARQQLNQVGFQKEGLRKAHRVLRSSLSSESSDKEVAEALAALLDAAKT